MGRSPLPPKPNRRLRKARAASEDRAASTSGARHGCEQVEFFRAEATVTAGHVEVTARVSGIAHHGTWGRIVFWPNGRHVEPRIVADFFETGNNDDFPAQVVFGYSYPVDAKPGEKLANLDYEMLLKCYDETTERFVLGWFDEYGWCREGEYVILQCDRGITFTLDPAN